MAFAFYSSFCKCAKRGRKIRRKKTKKLSQFLKSHISGTREAISLKFGMWSAEGGGNVHSKNRLVSLRQHRATEVRKLRFLFSCQYTHGCCAQASWAARHTTVCLDPSQSWYRDAPLYPPSVCQISRQSDIALAFYSSFCKCAKRGRKIRRKKKTKKLSQFLKSHISGTLEAISLKFGMWSAEGEGEGSVHSKNRLVSSRQHRATEVRKLRFLSSCQYTHGCYAPASWAA